MAMSIKYKFITDLNQVEIMRQIYNNNLDALSTKEKLKYKTSAEQINWWNNLDHTKVMSWLYYDENDKPIGFLLLTDRGRFNTPMFALFKEEWGKGYGARIIQDYILQSTKPLAGSQLQSNKAICHLNKKFGWMIISSENGVDYLFRPEYYTYNDICVYHGIKNDL